MQQHHKCKRQQPAAHRHEEMWSSGGARASLRNSREQCRDLRSLLKKKARTRRERTLVADSYALRVSSLDMYKLPTLPVTLLRRKRAHALLLMGCGYADSLS